MSGVWNRGGNSKSGNVILASIALSVPMGPQRKCPSGSAAPALRKSLRVNMAVIYVFRFMQQVVYCFLPLKE